MSIVLAAGAVPPFLILFSLVLGSVVVTSLILVRFRQSLLIGYFACGLLLANSGVLTWAGANSDEVIASLSEIGVVLLLFTLGIEFSVKELKALRRPVFIGGTWQMGLSSLLGFGVALACGVNWSMALVIGFALALSSTAVSLKAFQDLGQPETPQGRVTLGVALFQDLAVILFMVLLPALVGGDGVSGMVLLLALVKGILFVAGMVLLSRFGLPQIMDAVARTRSRELFTLTVIGLCAGVALISGLLGLSPALGAFAAGMVVSESIYSHRILSEILPFKDLFLTLFFVSIGLMIDTAVLMQHWPVILGIALMLLIGKALIARWAAKRSGLHSAEGWVAAAALASSGEFSLVLLGRAGELGALSRLFEQILLASTAISMALVPSLMRWASDLAQKSRGKTPASSQLRDEEKLGMIGEIESIQDHVVICGYGPIGKNLHLNLKKAGVRVIVIEMNPETVKGLLRSGVFCLFADATHPEALELAHIERARAIAFSFPDPKTVIESSRLAKERNPQIAILARAKYAMEMEMLQNGGIEYSFYDERETGISMIRRIMQCYECDVDPDWELEEIQS